MVLTQHVSTGIKEYQHHLATYGPQNTFGYKDFIPQFTASTFDPNAWATLFKQAGARYVVPVAEHHDGFALYDSHLSDWTAVKTGPKCDLLGELSTAIRAQGLHFGLSSHRAEHNWFFDGGRQFDSDINDPHYADLYGPAQIRLAGKTDEDVANDWTPVSQAWLNDWLARTTELIDRYSPELIYFDWWIAHPAFRNTLPTLLAYYYNHGQTKNACHAPPHHTPSTAPSPPTPITATHLTSTTTQPQCGVVVNYKLGALPDGAGTLDIERGQLTGIHPTHWQTDTSISNASWGCIENDTYKSPTFIIHMLADVVAKNGNLLLNIGPRADGSIPDAERTILLNIGKWLNINGTAIYDTHPWRTYGEGPTEVAGGTFQDTKTKPYTAEDFRFTVHGDTLYAIELGWPTNGQTVIHSINASDNVYSVTLLADNRPIPFEQHNDGLHLHLPNKPVGEHAYVFRITTHTPINPSSPYAHLDIAIYPFQIHHSLKHTTPVDHPLEKENTAPHDAPSSTAPPIMTTPNQAHHPATTPQHSSVTTPTSIPYNPHSLPANICPARHPAAVYAFTSPGVHWLRRGSQNHLVHAEGAAFLVNPAAHL